LPAAPVPNPAAAAAYFNAALEAHRARRVAEAERGYLQALAQDANHADACHLLGILRHEMGNRAEGERLVRHALTLRDDPLFHGNLGNMLKEMGRSQEAEASYRRALQLDPNAPGTHYNLAILCTAAGRKAEAVMCYRRALCCIPDFTEAHDNLGILMHEDKRLDEAEKCYRRALAIRPDFVEAYVNLGKLKKESRSPDEAEQFYIQALQINPLLPEAHNNLGSLFRESKRLELAQFAYKNALILRPEYDNAISNLAHVFQELGNPEQAEIGFHRAIAIRPDNADAYNGLGTCLHNTRRLHEAIDIYQRALELGPESSETYNNFGNLLRELNCFDEAEKMFQHAMEILEDRHETAVNYSFLLLHRGDFERGWHFYEERLKHKDREPLRPSTATFWQGDADLRGKTILLYAEQGMGDTLQFVRYASQVAALGAIVYLDVQAPLKSLIGSCPGVAGVFTRNELAPPFQYYAPLLSLPYILKTRLDTIPSQIPYLSASPAKVMYWRNRLGPKTALRVGLTWAGDPRKHMLAANALDRQRSLHFDQMLPLLDVPGIQFYSLQLGEHTAHQLNGHPQVIDVTSDIRDFEDTAAIVENLDLVITVDTSVCHLVGAVGKPVWMLNRHNTCWRWLNDRSDSPWYPTMRIFRQPELAEWKSVIVDVQRDLREWASQSERGNLGVSHDE
jgi:tetratricopeptide (TPR) repeat protein